MRIIYGLMLYFLMLTFCYADDNVLNVYAWFNEVPMSVIHQFEKETGIKVNFTTYEDNETMYAKLKAAGNVGYDIVEPSSYYVDRMAHENMLEPLQKNLLNNYHNLDPEFLNSAYDPKGQYAIPYVWGITGIYVNQKYFDPKKITAWADLWHPNLRDNVSLLDDPRDVFSMALISLGYSANDENPEHIRQAYEHLKKLLPNVKIFNSNAIPSIFIDEDVTIGMAWNANIYIARKENKNLHFIFPKEGFVIWVDNFVIPKNAEHLNNAYKFLNFILRPDIAKQATLDYGWGTTNLAGHQLLPQNIRDNPIIFPPKEILKRGQFQTNVNDQALALYAKYWELLKIAS